MCVRHHMYFCFGRLYCIFIFIYLRFISILFQFFFVSPTEVGKVKMHKDNKRNLCVCLCGINVFLIMFDEAYTNIIHIVRTFIDGLGCHQCQYNMCVCVRLAYAFLSSLTFFFQSLNLYRHIIIPFHAFRLSKSKIGFSLFELNRF